MHSWRGPHRGRGPRLTARASMAVICASDLRKEAASLACTLKVTFTAPPLPPGAATPRLPSEPRFRGRMASDPASPINPRPEPMGKKVGAATTPPSAKAVTRPGTPPLAKGVMLPASALKAEEMTPWSGFSPWSSAMEARFVASWRNTSSSSLPETTAPLSAPVICAPKRSASFSMSFSALCKGVVSASSRTGRVSVMADQCPFSVIGKAMHQRLQSRARTGADAAGRCQAGGEFTRGHGPEGVRRKPQQGQAETQCPGPGKGPCPLPRYGWMGSCGLPAPATASVPPNAAASRSAAMRA